MPRRTLLAALLVCVTALGAAVAPWTISSDPLTAAVAYQLRAISGMELTVSGRSVIAFLPVPRLKLEDVELSNPDGRRVLSAAQLRGEFSVLPLLLGRIELRELALNEADIHIEFDDEGRTAWDPAIAQMRARIVGETPPALHLRRISLTGSRALYRDRRYIDDVSVGSINAALDWPAVDSVLGFIGSAVWRDEPLTVTIAGLRPASLLTGGTSRVDIQANAAPARLAVSGEASLGPQPQASGRASFESGSLRDFLRWSGLRLPLGSSLHALSFESDFTAQPTGVSWPNVKMALGPDRLEGALSARIENSRLALAGTLAADNLTLTEFFSPFRQARTSGGLWSTDTIDLGDPTAGQLDLRLSAATARLGGLQLGDLAANIQVKPGRIDASLGRATLHRGTVKGRLTMAAAGPALDLRMTGSFDRVEAGAVLGELGLQRTLSGTAQGQFTVESAGETPVEVARQLNGRITSTIRQGELIGIGLADVLRRVDRRPLSALDWRGGRTPFEQVQLNLSVDQGVAEIVDGSMTAPAVRGLMRGRASFVDRSLAVKASFEAPKPSGPGPSITLDINGPWDDVSIAPDARALIERSGAAQPLLGPEARSLRMLNEAPIR